jgi:hypothetical protein
MISPNAFEWILHPVAPLAFLAFSLLACCAWFLSLKKELRSLELSVLNEGKKLEETKAVFQATLDSMQSKLDEINRKEILAEEKAMMLRPRPGINLNKRGQALRMHRRGENTETIASALSLPQGEVELLVKVYGMMLS